MSNTLKLLNTVERRDPVETRGPGKFSKVINSGFVFDRDATHDTFAMHLPTGDRFLSAATVLLIVAGIGLFIFITSYYTSKIRDAASKTEDVASKLTSTVIASDPERSEGGAKQSVTKPYTLNAIR
jgi:hypothetical protein